MKGGKSVAIRCIKTPIYVDKESTDRLFECNRISADVWNQTLDEAKKFALGNDGKWASESYLKKQVKRKHRMHSQSIQAVVEKYTEARDSAHSNRLSGHLHIKYPYRTKRFFNTKWKDDAFWFEGDCIFLSMGIWEHKRQPPIRVRLPKNTLDVLWKAVRSAGVDAIKEVELIYDFDLKLCISYEDGVSQSKYVSETSGENQKIFAGVDLGEIHAISAVASNGESIILTGRKLRSIHRLRNKKIREIQKAQARCTKGSRRWKSLQRKKRFVRIKSTRQVEDLTHKITKNFVDWCVENGVKSVFVGNPEGVQRGRSARNKRNLRSKAGRKRLRKRLVNQKISNWNFGKVMQYLEYKLVGKGIRFTKISEAYTSQTCPVCGARRKVSGRTYECKADGCSYVAHRDTHGAHNILSLGLHGDIRGVCEFKKFRTKYLCLK